MNPRAVVLGGALMLLGVPVAAQMTEVTISPAGSVILSSVQVTVAWCGYPPPMNNIDLTTRVIKVNGADSTSKFDLQWNPAACGFGGPFSDEELYTSTGTITVNAATGPVTVYAEVRNAWNFGWTAAETFYPPTPRRGVVVTADNQFVSADPGLARSERFTIRNLGTATDTFSITPSGCNLGAIATACTGLPATVTLAAGASTTVTASYTASGTVGSTGLLQLNATKTSMSAVRDSTWVDVTVRAIPAVGVSIFGLAPGKGDLVPREGCVTVALTEAAASECGDLRLAHALPPVRTMGTVRAPTLLYNSQHARPKPIVLADVRLSPGAALPDSIIACIKIGGVTKGCERWAGSAWGAPGNTRRIAVRADDGLAGGAHDFVLEITPKDGSFPPDTASARLFVVDRSASAFGAGWWLAGLERLTVVSGTVLIWTGGDGSVRRYVKDGAVFRAPKFNDLDSIVVAGTDYIRRTADHAQVRFNATGLHTKTTNSLGHETVFSYTSGRLTTIQVPTVSGTMQYTLAYNGSNWLDSIAAPGGRGTKLFRTGARVDSIRDPDGTKVRFSYGAGANQFVVTGRTDRRSHGTTFTYNAGNRLSSAVRAGSNTTGMTASETRGLSPLPIDSAYTAIDGPRSDVNDVSRLWVNAYGAPVRVSNPLRQDTRIHYHATWPGLADSVVASNRLGTRAFYMAGRGLLDSVRVFQAVGKTHALTGYTWHGSLNRVTSIATRTSTTTPNLVDALGYNGDGTLAWQQRGDSTTRTRFYYNGSKLPDSLVAPGGIKTIFTHSAQGNLRKERSPSGFLTFSYQDAIGRDTLVITPRGVGTEATDSAQVHAKGVRHSTRFNAGGRDSVTRTVGPTVTLPNGRKAGADTIRVHYLYDATGNLLSVTRHYTKTLDSLPGSTVQANPSQWQYDALNRVYQQRDAGADWTTLTLDPAGNAVTTTTPRGQAITATYDALNRVTQRVVPQVTFTTSTCHYPVSGLGCMYQFPTFEGPTLCIAVDTARFQYDAAGNLTQADNNWARIRRAYARTGLLTHDTLRTRRYETEAPNPCGGGDKRAVGDGPNQSDWSAHVYPLQYSYDLAGRRTEMHHPTQLDPCGAACVQTYSYHPTFGTLTSLGHPAANGGTLTTSFSYDTQLRLVTTQHPSTGTPRSTTVTYDADSRIHRRVGPVTFDTLFHDATGRVVSGTVALPGSGWLTPSLGYNGLGALQWASGATTGGVAEEFKTDALGNRLWVRDPEMLNNINRSRYLTISSSTGQLTGIALGSPAGGCPHPGAGGGSCHPAWYQYEFFQQHDASGNVTATWGFDTWGTPPSQQVVPEESRSYYSADEKLTYYNRHVGAMSPGDGSGGFTEYRYDALGRRIYSRARRVSSCAYPCEAYVQRTVWDGDHVLYEIRSSGKTGVSPIFMNQEGGVAPGDDYNLYGKIAYAHALGMDEPVGVLKHTNGTWYYLTPHANWQGAWSYGTLGNGNICTTVATQCPAWPGFQQSMDGWDQGSIPPTYTVWWGDLLRQGSDATRLQYRRNRYYDPQTGRFTQQDPIGLAGGMNLYGFAAGDPVNFSDPFGLCPLVLKRRDGFCPGGLEVDEWEKLEGGIEEVIHRGMRRRLRGMLTRGEIAAQDARFAENPNALAAARWWAGTILLSRAAGAFNLGPPDIGWMLVHEVGHLDQYAGKSVAEQNAMGRRSRNNEVYRAFLESGADIAACLLVPHTSSFLSRCR